MADNVMVPAAPHLVGIPRELRDNIYSNLHHEITFDWEWTAFVGLIPNKATVLFHNAPQASVLLTNSCLNEQYTEAACF
jgi:hypothetical protein